MKQLILTMSLVFLTLISFGQTTRTDVILVDSTTTKEQLYSNALSFFAINFKSANHVIQMADPVSGHVIGKGIVDGRDVIISLQCKGGRYKYDVTITTKITEIRLPINYLGVSMLGNDGVTMVPVIQNSNDKYVPNKSRAKFEYNNSSWSMYRYYYDGGSGHTPSMMTKGMWKQWKSLVDSELRKPKYTDLGTVPDIHYETLIILMNKHMGQKVDSDW